VAEKETSLASVLEGMLRAQFAHRRPDAMRATKPSCATPRGRRRSGANAADGRPCTVMVIATPAWTRASNSRV